MDLGCGCGVGEAVIFACWVEFPSGIGGMEDPSGAGVCCGAVVHDACVGVGGGDSYW